MEEEALKFAAKAHGEQKRKYSEELYIEHPKRVATIVRTVAHSREMIAAAFLHDVVEDTEVTLEEIENNFGKQVADLVDELTDEYMKVNYPHLNRKKRKEKEVARQATISTEAKTIKLADVIDNTSDIVNNDKQFARRYVPEMEQLVKVLKGGNEVLYERAHEEIQKAKHTLKL